MIDSPVKLLQDGKFNKSNIIVGVTRDDGSVFVQEIPGERSISSNMRSIHGATGRLKRSCLCI